MKTEITTPEKYGVPCQCQGKLECVSYQTRAYALEAHYGVDTIPMSKKMWIYTPYGYDPQRKYNVLFLMHGGTDDEGYWFGTGRYDANDVQKYPPIGNITKNMLDHLIHENRIEPLIVVAPSFNEELEPYNQQPDWASAYFDAAGHFWKDLRYAIMPCIQANYSTYAQSATCDAFAQARDHFAFCGASQGSITGLFSVMGHCLDWFSYIGCFSAGAICFNHDGKKLTVAVDDEKLKEIVRACEANPPRLWYNACGDDDYMYATHRQTYDQMLSGHSVYLQENQNCVFVTHPGGKHSYSCWIEDLYNVLTSFFK